MTNEGHDKLADLFHGMLRGMCPTELGFLFEAVKRILEQEIRACQKEYPWPVTEGLDAEAFLWDMVAVAHNYYVREAGILRRLENCDCPEDHAEYVAWVERDHAFMAEMVSRFKKVLAICANHQRKQMLKTSEN